MKPIERGEVLGLADYEVIRERFKARVIDEKKRRRLNVGPKASCVFENRDTVLFQIQEMLRTERITKEASIQHEIDTYNELVPKAFELSCTLMIEINDKEERETFLKQAVGLEQHIWLHVGGERAQAVWEKNRESTDRTTAVHYLKFRLSPKAASCFQSATRPDATITHVEIEIDHPAYRVRAALPAEAIVSLGEDLS
jgi:hypothetical protein